ncbi:MAG: CAP domain-containing protein, partial [Thermomicrobiales bacterium]
MKIPAFLLVALILATASIAMTPSVAAAQNADSACADSEEAAFLRTINTYRLANGAPPLSLSQTMSVAADVHSQDMATNDFLGHTGSNGSS